MRLERLCRVDPGTTLPIRATLCITSFKLCIKNTPLSFTSALPQAEHISPHSSNYGGQSAPQTEEENLTDLHSCHEWSSDHLQSHQLDVLSYPKSLLSYHSYTLGILMMALLFAVISGNSMTYLPGSWAKWTRQASLKIMIMETEGKIGIVLKFTRTFHILLSFDLAATHFQRRDKNTH